MSVSMSEPIATRQSVWIVGWSNPTKPIPQGMPSVMLRVSFSIGRGQSAGKCPKEIEECYEEMRAYGYAVMCHVEELPARQLPIASKQRIRRLNLWKRLMRRWPMFLSAFYEEQVNAKPSYYGPYGPGEFADMSFYHTTRGNLKQIKPMKGGAYGLPYSKNSIGTL